MAHSVVPMSMSISISAHYRINALNALNTAKTSASSIGDISWRCWVLDHESRCSVRSRRSDQSRRTHDGRTCRAVFLARRVGGGWPNEGAVVRRLGRPAYTARTGSPGHDCEDTYAPSYRAWTSDPICHIEPMQRSSMELSQLFQSIHGTSPSNLVPKNHWLRAP